MGSGWLYSCCLMGCCFQDLFNIALTILWLLPSIFFSIRLGSNNLLHPYCNILCFKEHHYSCDGFVGGDHRLEVFAPSSLCVCSQIPWRNQRFIVPTQSLFCNRLWEFLCCGSFSLDAILVLLKNFLNFMITVNDLQSIVYLGHYRGRGCTFVVLGYSEPTSLVE